LFIVPSVDIAYSERGLNLLFSAENIAPCYLPTALLLTATPFALLLTATPIFPFPYECNDETFRSDHVM
jgi:hypothetical protein